MNRADELRQRLEAFVTQRVGQPVAVESLTRLSGGAVRETWSFDAVTGGREQSRRRLILQRDPGRRRSAGGSTEFELLQRAADAGVPVPQPLWRSDDPADLGSRGFIMEFIAGETIPRRILRDDEFAKARPQLASQCGVAAARIHQVDVDGIMTLDSSDGHPARKALGQWRAILDSYGEPHPALEMGARWLERRIPDAGRICLVHGDFRIGNLIVDADGLQSVIDWELAHVGDPWEDLGWLCSRAWRFAGDGEVGGFGDRDDLYQAYEEASGVPVDRDAVQWWETFASFKWGVMCIMQSFTHLRGHVRSHELAAIGRRTAETEYDLLTLIRATSDL